MLSFLINAFFYYTLLYSYNSCKLEGIDSEVLYEKVLYVKNVQEKKNHLFSPLLPPAIICQIEVILYLIIVL